VLASVGAVVGTVPFSSLCASPEWLRADVARAFLRAYRKGRHHAREAPAEQVAALVAELLPDIDRGALTRTVADYQPIGCWRGDIAISRERA
jgi:ABC-type nitrate/sulfonate/bicarbonate transport system substrate-binding protein